MLGMQVWRRVRTGAGWLAGMMLLTHCGGAEEGVKDGQPPVGDTAEEAAELGSCEAMVQMEQLTVFATEDTHASAASPTTTYGELDRVVVDGDPRTEAFLKFNITYQQLQGGTIVRAKLHLNALDGTNDGPALYRTGTDWSEGTLNWDNRPGHASSYLMGDYGSIFTNQNVEYDVTPAVTEAGAYGFVLVPMSTDGVDFRSSEHREANLAPRLALTVAKSVCTRTGTGGDVAWTLTRGGEGHQSFSAIGKNMATAADGSFVTLASFSGQGNFGGQPLTGWHRFALAKYAADGSHLWSRAYLPYSAGGNVHAYAMALTPDGNILVVGNYNGAPDFGAGSLPAVTDEDDVGLFIARYSSSGDFVWARGFVPTGTPTLSPYVSAAAMTSDAHGNLIVTGGFVGALNLGGETFVSGTNDWVDGMFLAKFSSEGHHLWSLAVSTGPTDAWSDVTSAGDVLTDANGRIFIAGTAGAGRLGATASETPFVAAYNPDGTLLWSRAFNGAKGGVAGLALVPGGNIAFAGGLSGSTSFAGATLTSTPDSSGQPTDDALLGVLSASGTDVWARLYGAEGNESFYGMGADASGNITVRTWRNGLLDLGGGPLGHPTEYRTFLARFTSTGTHLWSRVFDPDLRLADFEVLPDGSTLLEANFSAPVMLNHQEHLPPDNASELLFFRLTP
jgi:hypothetical protein